MKAYERREAERLFPLLRSIGREVRTRLAELGRIQDRIAALAPTRHVHGHDVRRLESERSAQLRELRRAESELARLGCRLGRGSDVRILIPAQAQRDDHRVEGFLGQTRFRPAPSAI